MDAGTAEPEWRPEEFGLRWAVLLACLPVVVGVALAAALLAIPAAPLPPMIVQLIEPAAASSLASMPAEAPAPELAASAPPVPLQPPALVEPALPLLADVAQMPSLIPLPVQPAFIAPPLPARARPKPVRRISSAPVAEPAEAVTSAPAGRPMAAMPVAPPLADTSSGIGPYRAGLHAQIERNMMADESVRRMGVTGVATIEAVIAPDGRVMSTAVARSSGDRAIDRAAQAAVQRGGYGPFGPHMPPGPITISVPITVGDG